MLKKKEIIAILFAFVLITFSVSFMKSKEAILYSALAIAIILMTNILTKKIVASYLDSKINLELWTLKTYGFKKGMYFKKPLPMGIIMPALVAVLTRGIFPWMTSLVYEVEPTTAGKAKRHGLFKLDLLLQQEF
jgi:intracellular septation protein A